MINLGDKVKDTITDFEGTAVARLVYLNGCVQIQVQSKELKDGKIIKPEWIDEPQLIKVLETKSRRKRAGGGIRNRPPGYNHPSN